jgi:hypothetical protein
MRQTRTRASEQEAAPCRPTLHQQAYAQAPPGTEKKPQPPPLQEQAPRPRSLPPCRREAAPQPQAKATLHAQVLDSDFQLFQPRARYVRKDNY